MECDFNTEMIGDGLDRAGELGVGGTEIVVFHNSVRSPAIWALDGEQLGVGPSWHKAFEYETVGIAIATI